MDCIRLRYLHDGFIKNPSDLNACYEYGAKLWDIERMEEAITILKRCIKINKMEPLSYYYIALSLQALRKYQLSILYFNDALKFRILDDKSIIFFLEMGMSYECLEMYDKANTSYYTGWMRALITDQPQIVSMAKSLVKTLEWKRLRADSGVTVTLAQIDVDMHKF